MKKHLKSVCPFHKLFKNVMLSAKYGASGGRTSTNPKKSGRIRNTSQSTRKYDVKITVADLKELYKKQHGLDYWLGIPLDLNAIFEPHNPFSISVDRIDSSGHYTKNNIVLTSRMMNRGRGNFEHDRFREMLETFKFQIQNNKLKNVI